MKKQINKTNIILGFLACSAINASAITLDTSATGETSVGNGYSIAVTGGSIIDRGGNGIQSSAGNVVTFTFDEAVDFTIATTATGGPENFGVGSAATYADEFAADAGAWTFTAGLIDTVIDDAPAGSSLTLANDLATGQGTSTIQFGFAGTSNATHVDSDADWGSATISGVTSVTWTIAGGGGTQSAVNELFNFTAVTSVPEPSSTALLGLGGLALLARRKRA